MCVCVCGSETGCVQTSPSLWLMCFLFLTKNNRLLYLWMVFYLVPWFNVPCLSASQKCCIYYMPQRLCNCIILQFVFLTFCVPYRQCKLLSKLLWQWKNFCYGRFFCTFLDNDMDLWVEFWKFVSKCFQVFTWPYVHIYLWHFRKVCIVIQPEIVVNKLYIVKSRTGSFYLTVKICC